MMNRASALMMAIAAQFIVAQQCAADAYFRLEHDILGANINSSSKYSEADWVTGRPLPDGFALSETILPSATNYGASASSLMASRPLPFVSAEASAQGFRTTTTAYSRGQLDYEGAIFGDVGTVVPLQFEAKFSLTGTNYHTSLFGHDLDATGGSNVHFQLQVPGSQNIYIDIAGGGLPPEWNSNWPSHGIMATSINWHATEHSFGSWFEVVINGSVVASSDQSWTGSNYLRAPSSDYEIEGYIRGVFWGNSLPGGASRIQFFPGIAASTYAVGGADNLPVTSVFSTSATAYIDPYFSIPSEYLAQHPHASIKIDGLIGNSQLVPEPATGYLSCLGIFFGLLHLRAWVSVKSGNDQRRDRVAT